MACRIARDGSCVQKKDDAHKSGIDRRSDEINTSEREKLKSKIMGQKINPKAFRLGEIFSWSSRWFAHNHNYKHLLYADITLRETLTKKLKTAGVSHIDIERSINKVKITLHVAKPGMVIGRGGSGLEDIKKFTENFLSGTVSHISSWAHKLKNIEAGKLKVELAVEPIKEPNLDAYLVATNIADQLARRIPQKRVCNQALNRIMSAGAKGAKIALAGRIAGAEIARKEKYQAGTVPLSTIREIVDFAVVPSLTKSGYIGVKVWICKKQ